MRLTESTLDVPYIAMEPKQLANIPEPMAGARWMLPEDISWTNCDISCPPSAVYATTIDVRRNQNNTPVTISPGNPNALRDIDRNPPPRSPPPPSCPPSLVLLLDNFSEIQLASSVAIDVT
mmetsp:Transcript_77084/g.154539  ORF Transcript_77084/g.154539 Transcript_77084/m.154539 type:complete len:121 (+) Transcript_77084:958-1320(+)